VGKKMLDVDEVRRFTEGLREQVRRCDNGEGMICSNLDETINHYVRLCADWRIYINQWARAVFTGQIALDSKVENLLKAESEGLLHHAHQVAARGRAMDGYCYMLQGLNPLHASIADLEYLLKNWTSPQRSVSPAPRVKLPEAAQKQGLERLKDLPPLQSDWRPTDPEQLAFFTRTGGFHVDG
jgi:hypothetical protein